MADNLTSFESPNGVIDPNDFANCTVDTCPIVTSFYNYRIDLVTNTVLLALFSLAIPVYLGIWLATRRGHFFTIVMVTGLVAEVIGYIGRIKSYQDQWDETGFLMQIVCLTLAPAFFSAGIYVCLGRIIILYGRDNSRIPAEWYTRTVSPHFPIKAEDKHLTLVVHSLRCRLDAPASCRRWHGLRRTAEQSKPKTR